MKNSALKIGFGIGLFALSIVAIVIVACYSLLKGSLPALDGEQELQGLAGEVKIERDRFGAATITASNQLDAARGMGFAAGQESIFAMVVQSRFVAGELQSIFGKAAEEHDALMQNRFSRSWATEMLNALGAEDRALLESHAQGVEAGAFALSARPWQFIALGKKLEAWTPEDSLLLLCYDRLRFVGTQSDLEQEAMAELVPTFDTLVLDEIAKSLEIADLRNDLASKLMAEHPSAKVFKMMASMFAISSYPFNNDLTIFRYALEHDEGSDFIVRESAIGNPLIAFHDGSSSAATSTSQSIAHTLMLRASLN